MGGVVDTIFGIKKPHVDQTKYQDPYAPEWRARMMSIVDGYIKDKGLDKNIPHENLPYEYLSPDERAQIDQKKQQLFDAGNNDANAGYYPTANYPHSIDGQGDSLIDLSPPGSRPVKPPTPRDPEDELSRVNINNNPTPGDVPQRYSKAAMAAALQARQYGVDPDTLDITPPKALGEQNQQAQQDQLTSILDYIRGGRRGAYQGAALR